MMIMMYFYLSEYLSPFININDSILPAINVVKEFSDDWENRFFMLILPINVVNKFIELFIFHEACLIFIELE